MPSFDYSAFLTQASADARYQALGSLGSSTPASIDPDDAGAAGVSSSAARQDHQHAISTGAPVAVGAANAEGAGTGFARDTHVHLGPGTLGFASVTANQTGIGTSAVDLTNLAVPVTVVAGRRIKITAKCDFATSAGTGTQTELRIMEGATQVQRGKIEAPVATSESVMVSAVLTPSAGAHTYKLAAITGNGTVVMVAGADLPAYILVEDIGV